MVSLTTSIGYIEMPLAELLQNASVYDVEILYLVFSISSVSFWQVKFRGTTLAAVIFRTHSSFPVLSMGLSVSSSVLIFT